MALRDQPYLPLYIQDYLTDEKLNMCSAASQGVFIKLMCIMHKSEAYGKILFKQKYKQTDSMIENFAVQISKQITFDVKTIHEALVELIEEGVLIVENETVYQKRMVRDFDISEQRSMAAKKGGGNPILFKQKDKQEFKQKDKQITEDEYENKSETEIVIEEEKGVQGKKQIRMPFDSEKFKTYWKNWKEYKKVEHSFKYKSEQSEQSALINLSNLANGDEAKAIKIIMQSMENGWKGFFEITSKSTNGKSGNVRKTPEEWGAETDRILAKMFPKS